MAVVGDGRELGRKPLADGLSFEELLLCLRSLPKVAKQKPQVSVASRQILAVLGDSRGLGG